MDELKIWENMLKKNNKRKWNKAPKPNIDKSGIEYARRKGVTCLYVDIETGEIMQFGVSRSRAECEKIWDGMFPYRKMQAVYTKDYENFIEELKLKQKNNKL